MQIYMDEQKLDASKRYIQSVIVADNMKLVITFNSYLVTLIHQAKTVEVDTTFKRTISELKEWELTAWIGALARREYIYYFI